MSINEIIVALSTAVLALGWLFRLESKIEMATQKHLDLKEYLRDLMETKFDAMGIRLEKIERSLNGALSKD